MNNKIEKQVARWDLYAKIAPTIFLVVSTVSVTYGITSFDTLFNIGMIIFAFTAVTWWFWTIITIKYIIKTMSSATQNLTQVKQDLKEIRKEYRNDSN
tara:strand:+ start:246 stop:539 length:294 start_codon:yes stop_codon:yes gene_type:complete